MGADLYILDAAGKPLVYFRDSYGHAMLWSFELSWWTDIIPMLDKEDELTVEQVSRLVAMLKEREPRFEKNLAKLTPAAQERMRERYEALQTLLNHSIELGRPVYCWL
jgi:hypothetical protein